MIETLRDSYTVQAAILGAVIVGDFLLALLVFLLLELRKARENAEIRRTLTHFPPETTPTPESDEARRVREAREEAEAFRRLQNYGVRDAYGTGDSG